MLRVFEDKGTEVLALWIVTKRGACDFVVAIILQMDKEQLLKNYDTTLDAPLNWLVVCDQVVKGNKQPTLITLRRINQIAEASRLNIQRVYFIHIYVDHVFFKTLSRPKLNLPVHVPEVGTTTMNHLHVLFVSFFVSEPDIRLALGANVFDLWITVFIFKKCFTEPPLLVRLYLIFQ